MCEVDCYYCLHCIQSVDCSDCIRETSSGFKLGFDVSLVKHIIWELYIPGSASSRMTGTLLTNLPVPSGMPMPLSVANWQKPVEMCIRQAWSWHRELQILTFIQLLIHLIVSMKDGERNVFVHMQHQYTRARDEGEQTLFLHDTFIQTLFIHDTTGPSDFGCLI